MVEWRLFWAVNLPADLKVEIGRFQTELKKMLPDIKWVEQENLHLTVKFLGEVEDSKLPVLTRLVAESVSGLAPFEVELAGWGTFGRPPRVLWIGVGGVLEALKELRSRVDKALAPLGYPAEKKAFSPHLTLGRLRSTRNLMALRERADALATGRSWGSFVVKRIDLMQSTLTRRGPIYRRVESAALTGVFREV